MFSRNVDVPFHVAPLSCFCASKVETRCGYDPVLVEGKEARIKAKMPAPRPVAMGILPTPSVDFAMALMAAWRAANSSRGGGTGSNGVGVSMAGSTQIGGGGPQGQAGEGGSPELGAKSSHATVADIAGGSDRNGGSGSDGGGDGGPALGQSPSLRGGASDIAGGANKDQRPQDQDVSPGEDTSSATTVDPAAAGAGYAVWEGARTRGCYENVPGPKRRMRVYCFRSPPGEVEGWLPKTKKVRRKKKPEEAGGADQKGQGSGEGMEVEEGMEKDGGVGKEGPAERMEKDGQAGKEGDGSGEGEEEVEEEVEEYEVGDCCGWFVFGDRAYGCEGPSYKKRCS